MNRYFTAEDMQMAHEEMFNITGQQGNANEAPGSPHTHQKSEGEKS